MTPARFDVLGPLPTGVTLLEASAGTGKTWTIGALVTRYVAEGEATLDELLVITFGRAASQELRERVREQLDVAASALGAPAEFADNTSPLLRHLLDVDEPTRVQRHRNVLAALASYDSATIATTHQFCSMVLESLGVAGDSDARATLVDNLDELTREVVDDLFLRAFASEESPAFSYRQAMSIATAAINDPQAHITPELVEIEEGDPDGVVTRKIRFAHRVRAEVKRRKRRLGVLSYDDLLAQLADALEESSSPARARMRGRWRIVLVDEFQDTDPVQWQILERAFLEPARAGQAAMVLIGDPKQAIYAFRGGDIFTYLDAASAAATHQTLSTNYRSDQPLVQTLNRLLEGAALGDDRITVHAIAADQAESRLLGAPRPAPVRLRVVRRQELGGGPKGISVKDTRPWIARDLAGDIQALLESGATFDGRPLTAGDVAVIAYRHADLADAREALAERGIPAVIAGGGSVFATPAGVEWLVLLEALEQPHRATKVRSAALTSFFGRSVAELEAGGDSLTDQLAERLRDLADLYGRRGLAAVLEETVADGLIARVLRRVGGDRQLTDLLHVGEALHETAQNQRLGLIALVGWLRHQIAEARERRGTERIRRLDSDAAAVQLVTIHASKGLQYPVVYLPALSDHTIRRPDLPLYHDATGRRCRNLANAGPRWPEARASYEREEAGEILRLAYVAMTRAQSQVVMWWAPTRNAIDSPLHRLLAGRFPGRGEVSLQQEVLSDEEMVALAGKWAGVGALSPELSVPAAQVPPLSAVDLPELVVRTFTREVDVEWKRRSYSSLTAVEQRPRSVEGVVSEPEWAPRDDEPELAVPAAGSTSNPEPVASPMAELPVGATFGSLVHAVLEHADPDAPEHDGDLRAELASQLREQLVHWPVELDQEVLVEALVKVCHTPLGPLTGDRTLASIPLTDRLREMEFELPLVGGDLLPTAGVTPEVPLGAVADLLREHLPETDPVRGYAEALDNPILGGQLLRGYLTGSIDVALRLGSSFLVVDYKTNWLGGPREEGDPLTADDYRPQALDEAMGHSDYPLQALLYSLVLHRYLRWRLPDYDPEQHLGGVLYLYLRGLCGPNTPTYPGRYGDQPAGVFCWKPPSALVIALSDLMDGARASVTDGGDR